MANRLTFAELDFVLSGDPAWISERIVYGFANPVDEVSKAAGAASLIARGLAVVDGDDIVVDNRVAGLAQRLLQTGGTPISMALAEGPVLSSATLMLNPDGRTLVSLVAPGVIDVEVLKMDLGEADQLAQLARALLAPTQGVLAVSAHGRVLQLGHEGGAWSLAVDGADPRPVATEDLDQELRQQATELLDAVGAA